MSVAAAPKSVPLRTCVGCRTTKPQAGLLRFRRQRDGRIVVSTRSALGRSAYLCPTHDCYKAAIRRGELQRSLSRSGLTTFDSASLWADATDSIVCEIARLRRAGARDGNRLHALIETERQLNTRKGGA